MLFSGGEWTFGGGTLLGGTFPGVGETSKFLVSGGGAPSPPPVE